MLIGPGVVYTIYMSNSLSHWSGDTLSPDQLDN